MESDIGGAALAVKPETDHRILVLDGWRGLAILGVLIDHFFTSNILNLGRFGVELFFVLSGRLMADILFVRETPLRVFFPRRFSRIYPALFCFATILFLVSVIFHPFDISPTVYLSSLFFTMNYVAIVWDVSPATDHIWSLSIEEHMYLLLGALAALSRWRRGIPTWWIIVGLAAFGIVNGIVQTEIGRLHYHNVYWRTDVRGSSILISVAFYLWLNARDTRPWLLAQPLTPVLCALAAVLLSFGIVPDPIKYSLATLFLAISVSTITQAPSWCTAVLGSRVLTVLGVGSYSLYLWQQPFSLIPDPWVKYASFAAIGAIAFISYRFVEQPARIALNRLLTPTLHPAPAGPAA